MYNLSKLSNNPIIVLEILQPVATDALHSMFMECTEALRQVEGAAGFIIDMRRIQQMEVGLFAQNLQVFQRVSLTFKQDAPIFYALVGNTAPAQKIGEMMHTIHLDIRCFDGMEAAITFLNLKLEGSYIRQTLSHITTDELSTLHVLKGFNEVVSPVAKQRASRFPHNGLLRVLDVESQKTTLVFPQGELLVGRRSSDHEKPHIDLSLWAGFHKGVSRLHAKIVRDHTNLYLVDLNSANGTFLNGSQLEPNTPIVICDGDEVTFGRLITCLNFLDQMTEA